MRLKEIFGPLGIKRDYAGDTEIKGISHNSKDVKKGDLFVAIKGLRTDGHLFLEDAWRRGAAAFLVEEESQWLFDKDYGLVKDSREALSIVSGLFYKSPSKELNLIGITGTNGKTTTACLVESVLNASGKSVGLIGTIEYRYNNKGFCNPHTTPEASELQRILREMADSGVDYCVMEVSSHAVAMKRIMGAVFKCGVFTNLTQDHLDFHNDMEDYFKAKAKFFIDSIEGAHSPENAFSVINIDDERGRQISEMLGNRRVITYGRYDGNVRVKDALFSKDGIKCSFHTPAGRLDCNSKLIGGFNLYNIMAAVGICTGLGIPLDDISTGIGALKAVRGRMEMVSAPEGLQVVVDYAHTPSALECVLDTLIPLKKGRIITVFGCGGDRDKTKRPLMGSITAEKSDIVVLTSDNPRSEEPAGIIKDIERGISSCKDRLIVEPDRRQAIKKAIEISREGDTVLIAGKGHEDYQIIGGDVFPFSDIEEVEKALALRFPACCCRA